MAADDEAAWMAMAGGPSASCGSHGRLFSKE